jgi:hypothetical protein
LAGIQGGLGMGWGDDQLWDDDGMMMNDNGYHGKVENIVFYGEM